MDDGWLHDGDVIDSQRSGDAVMRPIRNMATIAMQEQPDNPLDDYFALLHAEDERLRQPQWGREKALVLPACTSAGGIAGDPRNQFELIAQLSCELTDAKLRLSDPCTQSAIINDAGSGGVCIPGSTKEVRCGIDQPISKIEVPVPSTANRVTNVPSQEPSRNDGRGPFQGPAGEDPPIQRPVDTGPASTGLHDEIETWVDEGGAGDDVV